MKPGATVMLASMAATIIVAAGCSMGPPKVVYPDGSNTVPANTPERIAALEQARARSRAMLSENDALRAEVAAMRKQMEDIRAAVAAVLAQSANAVEVMPQRGLPASPAVPAVPVKPAAAMQQGATQTPGWRGPIELAPAPKRWEPLPAGEGGKPPIEDLLGGTGPRSSLEILPLPQRVALAGKTPTHIRYFVRTLNTDETRFFLDAATREQIVTAAADAQFIEVTGTTDSYVADPPNQRVAYMRAFNARQTLIGAGIEAGKIRMRAYAAGHFAVPNDTAYGRSQNRRVEIIFFGKEAESQPRGI